MPRTGDCVSANHGACLRIVWKRRSERMSCRTSTPRGPLPSASQLTRAVRGLAVAYLGLFDGPAAGSPQDGAQLWQISVAIGMVPLSGLFVEMVARLVARNERTSAYQLVKAPRTFSPGTSASRTTTWAASDTDDQLPLVVHDEKPYSEPTCTAPVRLPYLNQPSSWLSSDVCRVLVPTVPTVFAPQ